MFTHRAFVLAVLIAASCSTPLAPAGPQIPVTILAVHELRTIQGDQSYLIDIEYRIPNGPLIHDQVNATPFEMVSYTAHELCAERRYAGYALVRCK